MQQVTLIGDGPPAACIRSRAESRGWVVTAAGGGRSAGLVLEAVRDTPDSKVEALRAAVGTLGPDGVLATTTSVLSVAELAADIGQAGRLVGWHLPFPEGETPILELVTPEGTPEKVVERSRRLAEKLGLIVVRVSDVPGLVVNRIALALQLEALRVLAEGVAGVDEIDLIVRRVAEIREGPFEGMDRRGVDLTCSLGASIWERLGKPSRYAPSPMAEALCKHGFTGARAGRGFYGYRGGTALPAVPVDRQSYELRPRLYRAVRVFVDRATKASGSITEQYIFTRLLAATINEAALLVDAGASTADDIDLAVTAGLGFPRGPLAWAEEIGRFTCRHVFDALHEQVEGNQFRPADWIRQ